LPIVDMFNRSGRNEQLYRGPSIDASYQVSVHLAQYRGPSIDASYQVSVHLAKQFQRRRLKCDNDK